MYLEEVRGRAREQIIRGEIMRLETYPGYPLWEIYQKADFTICCQM